MILYSPGATPLNTKSPRTSVDAFRSAPVAACTTETWAPVIGKPVESLTVPVMAPVTLCADAAAAATNKVAQILINMTVISPEECESGLGTGSILPIGVLSGQPFCPVVQLQWPLC